MHEVNIYQWDRFILVQWIWGKASLLTVVKKELRICTPKAMQRGRYVLKDMQYQHHACSAVNSRSLTLILSSAWFMNVNSGSYNGRVEHHDCFVIQGRGDLWLYCQKQLTWGNRAALVLVQLEFCSPILEECMCTWDSLHLAVRTQKLIITLSAHFSYLTLKPLIYLCIYRVCLL